MPRVNQFGSGIAEPSPSLDAIDLSAEGSGSDTSEPHAQHEVIDPFARVIDVFAEPIRP